MTTVVDTATFDFSVNRDDIIRLAMTDVGVLGVGEQIAPEDLNYCADKLNMLVKQWQGTADFAPGLKLWSRKRADLFLQTTKSAYLLGPTGDHWVASNAWDGTTLSVAAAAGALTITVASATGISAGDNIGILLNSGASHWTTVFGAPVGSVVTLSAAMPSAAAAGSTVNFYTAPTSRPLSLLSVVLRNSDSQDTWVAPMNLDDYESLPSKADPLTTGDPARYYYESSITNGTLYLDIFPNDASQRLHVVYLAPIADFNLSTDTPDYPQQWYRALASQLAVDIAPGFQVPITAELTALRNDSLTIARNWDGETTSLFFQCNADWDSQ